VSARRIDSDRPSTRALRATKSGAHRGGPAHREQLAHRGGLARRAFGGLGWWLRTYHFAGVSTLVTLGAVAIATFAGFQAARSAHASSKTSALDLKIEERAKYGWTITVHPEGDRYVLRNMATRPHATVDRPNRSGILWILGQNENGPNLPHTTAAAMVPSRMPQALVPLATKFDPASPCEPAAIEEHAALVSTILVEGLRLLP
jgi:hypothetical protein